MAAPALIAQTAVYEETGPYIDGLSTALTGYRTAGAANTAGDLPTGTQVIVTAFKTGAYANFLVWLAKYDHANTRFSRTTLLASGGTIADEDGLDIYVSDGGQLLTNAGELVKAHGTLSGNATIDVAEGHVHTMTINADRTLTLENTQDHTGTGLTLLITKGANTITWAGDFNATTGWIGGAPNISAADDYVIFFHWLGSSSTCYAVYGGKL